MSQPSNIVVAKPPSRRHVGLYQPAPTPPVGISAPGVLRLSPSEALTVFVELLSNWQMPPGRGWRMLTGLSKPRSVLTEDQSLKAAYLLAIDAGMREIGGKPVGEWMVQHNPSPFFGNTVPADYLTRRGLPGYVELQRQVRRWASM